MEPHNPYFPKKTKIVCTIGPACESKSTLVGMIEKGMNIARLNCSHGDHATLARWIENIRQAEEETGIPIPIMLDLQGPKIRIGLMKEGKPVVLSAGKPFTITTSEIEGTEERVSTTYRDLPHAVSVGDHIFINDGLVRVKVTAIAEAEIQTVVEIGGVISDHKGLNVPGGKFVRKGLTEKDKKDIEFGKKFGIEAFAISFVEKAQDIQEVKKLLETETNRYALIAKIEKPTAVRNLEEILHEVNGVMIARGDLGVEIRLEKVPLTQKEIIKQSMAAGKFTIVATQMLETMVHGPRPTRAEVSDVANSIMDQTDSLMLSAETAMGDNPIQAVQMMSNVALEIEAFEKETFVPIRKRTEILRNNTEALTRSAVEAAFALNLSKIVAFTKTGRTALSLSLRRPPQLILAFSPELRVRRQMQLLHGVCPIPMAHVTSLEEQYTLMEQIGRERKLWKKGETLIVVSGPPGITGGTNVLKVHSSSG